MFEVELLVQGLIALAVRVIVTLPTLKSATLGLYVGVKVVPFVNVPVPLVAQLKAV